MTRSASHRRPPGTILLATDLSSRCDRAMQRALQLSRLWAARLVILNVVETGQAPSLGATLTVPPLDGTTPAAERHLRRQFGDLVMDAEVRVVEGDPVVAIERTARDVGAELIVTGVARNEALGRFLLGSTVDRLAAKTPIPLLIVKSRVWPYEEILVASDLSRESHQALIYADRLFPDHTLTVLYCAGKSTADDLDLLTATARRRCEDFIARSALSPAAKARANGVAAPGRPDVEVPRYMVGKDIDLVVVGARERRGALGSPLGGTATRILEAAPGDVLLIRGSAPAAGVD